MTLLFTVQVSNAQTMAVYKLSTNGLSEYGKQYALMRNQLNDRALERYPETLIVNRMDPGHYEKLYDTALEAYLAAKLVAATGELDRVQRKIKEFQNTQVRTIDWDPDFTEE